MVMAYLASDNFNRADESPIASPWVDAPWVNQAGMSIVSNRASSAINDSNRGAYYDGGIAWPNDQYSKAKMYVATSADATRQGPALYVRLANGVNTCYRFSTDHAASANCNVSRFVADTRTTIVDFTQAWSDGDTWELRVEGPPNATRIRTFLNGVQKSDNTDNSSVASGYPGIGVSNSTTITSWSIDDWEGGSGFDISIPPITKPMRVGRW